MGLCRLDNMSEIHAVSPLGSAPVSKPISDSQLSSSDSESVAMSKHCLVLAKRRTGKWLRFAAAGAPELRKKASAR